MNDLTYFWIAGLFPFLLLFIFACLYFIERKRYISLWAFSWLFYTLSYLVYVFEIAAGSNLYFTFLQNIFLILAVWAIAQGTLEFFTGKWMKPITGISLAVLLYSSTVIIAGFPETVYAIPRTLWIGALLIYTGIFSLRIHYLHNALRYLLGAFYLLWGGSSLFFLLGYFFGEQIFMISYSIINLFPMATSLCLQIVYFQYNREVKEAMDAKMRYLVSYDPLTGIHNRGYCEIALEKMELEGQIPISIILGDLNGLKLVNDTFGHQKGDKLIAKTAEIMKSVASEHLVGRWGGDEFIIILPDTDFKKAQDIMEKIKKKCREQREIDVPFEISLGAATKEKTEQRLAEIIGLADNMLYKNKLQESGMIKKSMVSFLTKTLIEKNIESADHLQRMEYLALLMGKKMDLSERELEELALAAHLHDIGKISIPENVLRKKDKLTADDWDIIRRHPEVGFRIMMSSEVLIPISQSVLYHHENWDGTGYPQGLKGDKIPLAARIISVVDSYEVMTQRRVYKKTLSDKEALKEIERCSGSQFDPSVVNIFIKMIQDMDGKIFESDATYESSFTISSS